MTRTVDLSGPDRRVLALPAITLDSADTLGRDYGLTVSGPDADGCLWGEIADPASGARGAQRLCRARSADGRAWLAWRARRSAH